MPSMARSISASNASLHPLHGGPGHRMVKGLGRSGRGLTGDNRATPCYENRRRRYSVLQLRVTGMTCAHCVRAVGDAVRAVPGTESVAVDLASGTVRVQGAPDPDAVRAAIEAEGYEVAAMPA